MRTRLFHVKRLAAGFSLLVCLVVCAHGETKTSTTLTLAAYNVENFTDVFDDPYTKDEETAVKPRSQIERIAANLREMNADVVAFVEVENEGVLRAMTTEFLPEMGYQYFVVLPCNSDRGISVGLMSRRPIISATSHRYRDLTLPGEEKVWRFGRDLLRVTIQATQDRTLDVFVVHFKSRISSAEDPKSGKWRLAEATMTRTIIDHAMRQDPKAWIAVVGDFNDTPDTKSIQMLTSPSEDNLPGLIDTHAALPPEQRITYLKEPYRSTIDYVLVSPALGATLIPGSSRVLNSADHDGGSDHAPLAASFDLE